MRCPTCGADEAPSACANLDCAIVDEIYARYKRACATASCHPLSFSQWSGRRSLIHDARLKKQRAVAREHTARVAG